MSAYKALDEAKVRNAKPRAKVYRLNDGLGLALQIMPSGSRQWVYRYRFMGLQRMMSLGSYPAVSLKDAREAVLKHRAIVQEGQDPVQQRKVAKLRNVSDALQTFESVSREWLERNKSTWSAKHYERYGHLLKRALLPTLGNLPIHQIDTPLLLAALKEQERYSLTNARKARSAASLVFDYAVASGRMTTNPAKGTLKALAPRPPVKHHKALTVEQLGPTLRALADSRIRPVTKGALLMMLYTGLRDHSLRGGTWKEIDFEQAIWTIDAVRMKGRAGRKKPHVVPLPKQALAVLRELANIGEVKPDAYIFPNQNRRGHMAEKTLCTALRTVSQVEGATAHGLRATITSFLYERGYQSEVIEVQMAHDVGTLAREFNEPIKQADSGVRSAYLRTAFLPQRREMMQEWADAMDALRDDKPAPARNVVRIRGAA